MSRIQLSLSSTSGIRDIGRHLYGLRGVVEAKPAAVGGFCLKKRDRGEERRGDRRRRGVAEPVNNEIKRCFAPSTATAIANTKHAPSHCIGVWTVSLAIVVGSTSMTGSWRRESRSVGSDPSAKSSNLRIDELLKGSHGADNTFGEVSGSQSMASLPGLEAMMICLVFNL